MLVPVGNLVPPGSRPNAAAACHGADRRRVHGIPRIRPRVGVPPPASPSISAGLPKHLPRRRRSIQPGLPAGPSDDDQAVCFVPFVSKYFLIGQTDRYSQQPQLWQKDSGSRSADLSVRCSTISVTLAGSNSQMRCKTFFRTRVLRTVAPGLSQPWALSVRVIQASHAQAGSVVFVASASREANSFLM